MKQLLFLAISLSSLTIMGQEKKNQPILDTVTYIGSEFVGYCMVHFKKVNGEEITFYNPELGDFKNEEGCGMIKEATKKTFLIVHQIKKQEIYSEDAGSQVIEKPVLLALQFPKRDEQFLFFENLKKEKKAKKKKELLSFLKRNKLPIRQEFDCPYCNEMKFKKMNVCSTSEVKKAILNTYWSERQGRSYSAEVAFFENDTLLVYYKTGEHLLLPYKIEICKTANINGKTNKVVKISITGRLPGVSNNVLYLCDWNAANFVGENGGVFLRPGYKQYLWLDKLVLE